jgi:SAM-dependent methyltransferase
MRSYSAEKYKELVADIEDETLQRFMSDEQKFVAGIEDAKSRTFIDLGAGYGRVEPFLSRIAKNVIAIEINPNMYSGLERTVAGLENVDTIRGDFSKLSDILHPELEHPVFLLLQNTLGTLEDTTLTRVLEVVANEARKSGGDLVMSLFRQPGLRRWGLDMYAKITNMVGKVDMDKTNLEMGYFVTDKGYISKWWTDKEMSEFRAAGQVVREFDNKNYAFLEITFSRA